MLALALLVSFGLYIICCIISFGFLFAYFQRRDILHCSCNLNEHFKLALILSLFGPLGAIGISSQKSGFRYGIKFYPREPIVVGGKTNKWYSNARTIENSIFNKDRMRTLSNKLVRCAAGLYINIWARWPG